MTSNLHRDAWLYRHDRFAILPPVCRAQRPTRSGSMSVGTWPAGLPLVVTDGGVAAGMSGGFYFGTPSIWTGC